MIEYLICGHTIYHSGLSEEQLGLLYDYYAKINLYKRLLEELELTKIKMEG